MLQKWGGVSPVLRGEQDVQVNLDIIIITYTDYASMQCQQQQLCLWWTNRWYCHFDDDVYVNIPMLISSLSTFDPDCEKVYIGRWPLAKDHLTVPDNLFSKAFPVHVRT